MRLIHVFLIAFFLHPLFLVRYEAAALIKRATKRSTTQTAFCLNEVSNVSNRDPRCNLAILSVSLHQIRLSLRSCADEVAFHWCCGLIFYATEIFHVSNCIISLSLFGVAPAKHCSFLTIECSQLVEGLDEMENLNAANSRWLVKERVQFNRYIRLAKDINYRTNEIRIFLPVEEFLRSQVTDHTLRQEEFFCPYSKPKGLNSVLGDKNIWLKQI